MKNVFYIFLCLGLITGAIAQNNLRNANWALSYNGGLNFNPLSLPSPQPWTSSIALGTGASASVSSPQGELLFYTDGFTVWNHNHTVMTNGDNLISGLSELSQNKVIIPNPQDVNKYYIFSISCGQRAPGFPMYGLRYSEVDMSDGVGVVTFKNIPLRDEFGVLIDNNYPQNFGKITTARHANGIDYWLIAEIGTRVCSYLIDDQGIIFRNASDAPIVAFPFSDYMTPAVAELLMNVSAISSGNGPMKISPDNRRILIGYADTTDSLGNVDGGRLFEGQFDDVSGAVGDFVYVPRPLVIGQRNLTGAEFSPDSDRVFHIYEGYLLSTAVTINAFKMLEIGAFTPTQITIEVKNLQRAIDDRIYFESYDINNTNPYFISVIDNPNSDQFVTHFSTVNANSTNYFVNSIPPWVQSQDCLRTLTTADQIQVSLNAQREEWIKSSDIISTTSPNTPTRVIYHAGDYIELLPGFETQNDSEFVAYILGCTTIPDFNYKIQGVGGTEKQLPIFGNANKIQISPNPTSKSIAVQYEDGVLSRIQIMSLDGKVIYDQRAGKEIQSIDVSNYAAGIYIVSAVAQDGKTLQSKFIKN